MAPNLTAAGALHQRAFASIAAASSPSGFGIGEQWVDNDLVFANRCYTELDAANVRRAFRTVAVDADPQAAVAGACATSSTSQPIASRKPGQPP